MTFRETFKDLQKNNILSVLGETALYTPSGYPHTSNKTRTITGRFVDEYQEILGVGTGKPAWECPFDDVSDATNGAGLTYNSIEYTVAGPPQKANNEMVVLMLEKT